MAIRFLSFGKYLFLIVCFLCIVNIFYHGINDLICYQCFDQPFGLE